MTGVWWKKVPKKAVSLPIYLFLLLLTVIYFYPMVWMVISGFKSNMLIFQQPFALPETVSFRNWTEAWRIGRISRYTFNSVTVTTVTVFFVLFFSSLAAYAFARIKFRFQKLLQTCLIVGLFIPIHSYFIAQNTIIRFFNISDTYLSLILPYIAMGMPLAVYLLIIYFRSIPKEIEESAVMDGAGQLTIYFRIMLPIVTPGFATVGIFTALATWNEFLLALLYIQDPNLKTLTVGMLGFSGRHATNYALLCAGLSIVTIPMIAVYFLFNKKITAGLIEGAVKG
jgi:raffinose/stachyose/melibiose transport system permease protein